MEPDVGVVCRESRAGTRESRGRRNRQGTCGGFAQVGEGPALAPAAVETRQADQGPGAVRVPPPSAVWGVRTGHHGTSSAESAGGGSDGLSPPKLTRRGSCGAQQSLWISAS